MVKRIKVTLEGSYTPKPADYPGCKTIEDMLEMDKNNENLGLEDILMSLDDPVNVTYEIIDGKD